MAQEIQSAGQSDEASLIDWDVARHAVGGDEDLLRDVAQAFLVEAPSQLEGIRKSLETNDAPVLRRMAHTLKSSARIFGIQSVCDLCFSIELSGKEQQLDGVLATYDQLTVLMDRVTAEMTRYLSQRGAA